MLRHANLSDSGTLMADGPGAMGTHERTQRPVTLSSSPGRTGRRGNTTRWVFGVLAAGLAVLAATAIALFMRRSSVAGPPQAPTSPADPFTAGPPRSSAASTLAPELTRAPQLPPAPTLTPALDSAQTAASSAPKPRVLPKAGVPARPATTTPSCDPPFIIDGAGIKHPKPECL